MNKYFAIAAFFSLATKLASAGAHPQIDAPSPVEQSFKISVVIVDGANQRASFALTTDSTSAGPATYRSGIEAPYLTPNKEIGMFFSGVSFSVEKPSITADNKIKLDFRAEKSELKKMQADSNGKDVVSMPGVVLTELSKVVLLDNDKDISLPFGSNVLNIRAKLLAGDTSE